MKQIYTFFAVMMMAIALPQVANAYDFSAVAPSGQTLYYSIIGGKAQIVSPNALSPTAGGNGYSGYIEPTGDLVIPNSVSFGSQSYTVFSIGAYAFKSCTNLTSVTIPDSISVINIYAFAFCSGLTTVNFNATNCTLMGSEQYLVFKNCTNLQVLNIGRNVKTIPVYGFWRCGGLTTVNFNADSCTTIGNSSYPYAFYECNNFTTLNIGNNVKALPSNAFRNCTMINNVNIPDSVTSIGSSVFYNCSNLESVSIGEGLTTIGDYTFVNCSSLSNIFFSDNITSIGYSAFSGCSGLSTINLPQSITLIDANAFRNCTGLTAISIPLNVNSIGTNAMFGCTNIDTVFMNPIVPPQLGTQALHKDYSRVEKTIILSGCSFDAYYNASTWTTYRNYLQEKPIELFFNLDVNDEFMGSCEIIQLRGRDVRCDTSVVIQATANHGYEFAQWSNGRTNNPDTLYLLGDSNVTAIFSTLPTATLSLESSDDSKGTVIGSGTYVIGDSATAIGVAHYNYRFMGWSDGSNENPRHITLEGDSTLIALFLAADTIDVHDTIYVDVPYPVHDTTIVHDTAYVDVPYPVHDTTVVHDTTYIDVPYPVHDTILIHDTTYVDVPYPVHDTAVVHDTTYIDVPYPVHDTTVVHDTTYIDMPYPVHDTMTVVDTLTITDTLTVVDTLWLTLYDTVWLHDTVMVHDTIYIHDEGIDGIETVDAKIYQRDGRIVVESGDGGPLGEVRVFDVMGRNVATGDAAGHVSTDGPSRTTFEVPASGAYIVKIGNNSARKILVIR